MSDEWVDLGNAADASATATAAHDDGCIPLSVKLEEVPTSVSFFQESPGQQSELAVAQEGGQWKEFLMTLTAEVPRGKLGWLEAVKDEEADFMVILDRSGSMSGGPWRQVQSAASRMLEVTADNRRVFLTLMVYNDRVEVLPRARSEEIKRVRAGGSTNFVEVFRKIKDLMQERMRNEKAGGDPLQVRHLSLKKRLSSALSTASSSSSSASRREAEKDAQCRKLFVFFMTDGCDTCNSEGQIMHAKEKLQDVMGRYGHEVVVHALGFSQHHDDSFLEALTLLGTADGTYSFISPSDGDVALEKRLTELLEAATGLVGKSVFLDLNLQSELGQAGFLGDWFGKGDSNIVLPAFLHVTGDGSTATLNSTKFVRLPVDEKGAPHFTLTAKVLRDLKEGKEVSMPCRLTALTVAAAETQLQLLPLRKLRAGINMVSARLGNAADEGGDGFSREVKAVEGWLAALKAASDEVAVKVRPGQDQEVDKLAETVSSGLKICQKAITREDGESEEHSRKKTRNVATTWNIASCQMYNSKQVKRASNQTDHSPVQSSKRGQKQMMQKFMD